MDRNRFRVGDFEYRFSVFRTPDGWTFSVVQTNHDGIQIEERVFGGDRAFPSEEAALSFAENRAHDLARAHIK